MKDYSNRIRVHGGQRSPVDLKTHRPYTISVASISDMTPDEAEQFAEALLRTANFTRGKQATLDALTCAV